MLNATPGALHWFVSHAPVIASFNNNPIYNQLDIKRRPGEELSQKPSPEMWEHPLWEEKSTQSRPGCVYYLHQQHPKTEMHALFVSSTLGRETRLDTLRCNKQIWLEGNPEWVTVTVPGLLFPKGGGPSLMFMCLYITICSDRRPHHDNVWQNII